jgi:hypothetical protein
MADQLGRLKEGLADRYGLVRELGRGGMATVYLAEDLKHHRKVALKVLRPEVAATLGPERFIREIEIVAALAHPCILPGPERATTAATQQALKALPPEGLFQVWYDLKWWVDTAETSGAGLPWSPA